MNLIFFQYLNKEITCKYIDSVSPTVYRVMSKWEILDYIPIPTPILFSFAIVCWCGRAIRSLLLESVLQSRPDIGFDQKEMDARHPEGAIDLPSERKPN